MKWDLQHIAKLKEQGKIKGYKVIGSKSDDQPKLSKYRSRIVVVDGIKFRSTKEANRYIELKLLQEKGIITDLKLQVGYELNEGGKYSLKYYADFNYISEGETIVEDCKGFRTVTYKKKAKLMKKIYGITIKET